MDNSSSEILEVCFIIQNKSFYSQIEYSQIEINGLNEVKWVFLLKEFSVNLLYQCVLFFPLKDSTVYSIFQTTLNTHTPTHCPRTLHGNMHWKTLWKILPLPKSLNLQRQNSDSVGEVIYTIQNQL